MSHDRRLNDLRSVFRVQHKRRAVDRVLVSKIDGEAVCPRCEEPVPPSTHLCGGVNPRPSTSCRMPLKLCRVVAIRE